MKVCAVIPARAGSKGIRDKNLSILHGKTLVDHAVAFASQIADLTIISTDINGVLDKEYDSSVLKHHRTSDLSNDTALAWDVWKDAVNGLENDFDIFLYLEPTSPDRRINEFEECFKLFDTTNSIVSLSEIKETKHHKSKQISFNCLDQLITKTYNNEPRQSLEPVYIRNGVFYACDSLHLERSSTIINKMTLGYFIHRPVVNIDTIDDLNLARSMTFTSDFINL